VYALEEDRNGSLEHEPMTVGVGGWKEREPGQGTMINFALHGSYLHANDCESV
jgi:hypothetical protein